MAALLVAYCPDFFGQSPVEFELAADQRLDSLIEAHDPATGENRERIEAALLRAFKHVVEPVPGVSEDWKNACRQWLASNPVYEVNYLYPDCSSSSVGAATCHLFVNLK